MRTVPVAALRIIAVTTRHFCRRVCHPGCAVVRINGRGPFVPGRHIDLTPAAARAIGLDQIARVTLEH
jgi:rare lipoprotein A